MPFDLQACKALSIPPSRRPASSTEALETGLSGDDCVGD